MAYLLGYGAVLLSSILFAASSIIIKLSYLSGIAPNELLILQNAIAGVSVWFILLARGQTPASPRRLLPTLIAQGTIGGFLTTTLFFTAIDCLGASLATLLFFTYPALVAIYNRVWRGTVLSSSEQAAVFLAIVGVGLSVDIFSAFPASLTNVMPILIGLGAAVANTFLNVNGEKLLAELDTVVVTAWSYLFSTAMMFLYYRPVWLFDLLLTRFQWSLVAVAAMLMLMPVVCYYFGMKRVGSGISSIVSTIEIPLTLLLAYFLLGETLSAIQVLGGSLIAASVFILYFFHYRSADHGSR